MRKAIINDIISEQRFDRYLEACRNNEAQAFEAYEANLLISKDFCPLLSVLEVALRNRLNVVLSQFFSDKDWILNQKRSFMSHPRLGKNFLTKNIVETAEKQIIRRGLNPRHQIITELTFAFWVRLFQADHFGLLKAEPRKVFDYMPKSTKSDKIHTMLKSVVDFRNRVYHNEPICFGLDKRTNESMLDLSVMQDVYENLYTLLFWLGSSDLPNWVQHKFDRESLIHEAKKVNEIILQIGKGRLFTLARMP